MLLIRERDQRRSLSARLRLHNDGPAADVSTATRRANQLSRRRVLERRQAVDAAHDQSAHVVGTLTQIRTAKNQSRSAPERPRTRSDSRHFGLKSARRRRGRRSLVRRRRRSRDRRRLLSFDVDQ